MTELDSTSKSSSQEKSATLFSDVKFIIAQCNETEAIKNLLIGGGAKHINYLSEHVTLVISDTNCPEAEEAKDLFDKPVVSSSWVHLSLRANKLLPTEAFSPINCIFQNVVASFSPKLSKNDTEILAAALTFHGAGLSKNPANATHFIVASSNDNTLSEALDKHKASQITHSFDLKIVSPDWVVESIKTNICCDEQVFDPNLLLPPPPPTPPKLPTPPLPVAQTSDSSKFADLVNAEDSLSTNATNSATTAARVNLPESQVVESTSIKNANPYCQQSQTKPPSHVHHQNHQPIPTQQQQYTQHQYQIPQQHMQSHPNQPLHHQQMQSLPPSQLPRARMPSNVIRGGLQHKFRPLLPNATSENMPNVPTTIQHQSNAIAPADSQQPKKVTIQYGQCMKMPPYQNNVDPQHHQNLIQPQHQPSFAQQQQQHQQIQHHHPNIQQPINSVAQPSRLPQQNMYNQVRGSYQSTHMNPRGISHQQQPMLIQQPAQVVNQFQEPSNQLAPRPYQLGTQNYQNPANMPQRQQIYYNQNPSQPPPQQQQLRLPQQAPTIRHMPQKESNVYDNYSSQHSQDQNLIGNVTQHHYQPRPLSAGQQQFSQAPNQPQQSSNQQQIPQQTHVPTSQPPMVHPRQQFQPNFAAVGPNSHVRTPRATFTTASTSTATTIINHQHELKANNITNRHPNPNQITGGLTLVKGPRLPSGNISNCNTNSKLQPKPHPSIFNHIQESNLALIKAKVPNVTEAKNYFGHDPKENVPKDLPFIGCRFKLIDYDCVNSKKKEKWCEAITLAGGSFDENLKNLTHLICEDRTSPTFNDAIKLGVRCVTIYWINDVLGENKMSYPWKALHFPLPFSSSNRPLLNEVIAVTNVKGKERREVKEMILKTGARYTDYFSSSNTLIICGDVGGEKYERAIEWRIPFSNCNLLTDVLLSVNSNLRLMLSQTKYQLFNQDNPLKLNSYSEVLELIKPWTTPVSISAKDIAIRESSKVSNGDIAKSTSLSLTDDSGITTGGSNNSDIDGVLNKKLGLINNNSPKVLNGEEIKSIQSKDLECKSNQSEKVDTETTQIISVGQPSLNVIETSVNEHTNYPTSVTSNTTSQSESTIKCGIVDISDCKIQDMVVEEENNQELSIITSNEDKETNNTKEISPQINRVARVSNDPIRLLFTHLDPALSQKLRKCALEMGMGFASSPINCTHLVVSGISRTPKFVCSFSHATYILSYNWILESYEAKNVLDEKQFILQDKNGEEKYSFNLSYSLSKRKKRGRLLFSNLVFFVTPTVISSVSNVKEMIESAGGAVATKKLPSRMQINQLKSDKKGFVLVSCKQDLHLCSALENIEIDIVSVEFVICGILRQDIDFEAHRLKANKAITTFVRPETNNPTAQISNPSPPKKLRLNDSSC